MASTPDQWLNNFLAPFDALVGEAVWLAVDARAARRAMEMTPADLAEALRMIQEVRRFLAVPMPEEKLPF